MQQCRCDRGIDAARKAADDIARADLTTDLGDRLGAKPRHCPVAATAGDLAGEVAQQRAALRRVYNLGMKEDAIETPDIISDRSEGCGLARGDRAETGRQRVDPVAMAHPHLLASAPLGRWRPQSVEQQAIIEDVDERPAELLMLAQRYPAAQFVAHRLHAVADPEHRDPEPEDDVWGVRRIAGSHRGGAARQDDRIGCKL